MDCGHFFDFGLYKFFVDCRQLSLLIFEQSLLSPLNRTALITGLFELFIVQIIALSAHFKHLICLEIACIDSIFYHNKQFFVRFIAVIAQLFSHLLDNARKVIWWVGLYELLPDWECEGLDYTQSLEYVFYTHVHKSVIIRLHFFVFFNSFDQLCHVLSDFVDLHLRLFFDNL